MVALSQVTVAQVTITGIDMAVLLSFPKSIAKDSSDFIGSH